MPDETQQLVAARYRLERTLGEGGMGQVWAAEDTVLGRPVAIKAVDLRGRGNTEATEALRARVMREARAAARIDNPGSVRVFDVVDEQDTVYLIMELVEAPTLADVVSSNGPLSHDRAARLGLDVLGALAAAHASGIVHRDVKPHNVMVVGETRAKLADFGIASVKDDPNITSTGMLLGTPRYMSPEQARGETAGAPSDLWGLGALLYYAVEGEPPFDRGTPLPTLHAVLHDEPRPLTRVDGLSPVIEALLDKDPARRPTAEEARGQLERLLAGEATTVADAGPTVLFAGPVDPPTTVAPTAHAPVAPTTPAPASRPAAARRPAGPPPVGDTDRKWLAAVAAVGLVALLAALAIVAVRNDDDGGETAATDDTTPVAPTDETATTEETEAPTTEATTTEPAPTTTAAASGDRPDGVPADWVEYRSDVGWTMWHPPSWRPQAGRAGSVDFTHGSGDYLRVDSVAEPGDDPVAAWEAQEEAFRAENPDYERIRIEETDYRGWDAAIWEYTFRGQRAANLGFVAGDRGYALNLVTAQQRWDATADEWEAFKAAFEPAGGGD